MFILNPTRDPATAGSDKDSDEKGSLHFEPPQSNQLNMSLELRRLMKLPPPSKSDRLEPTALVMLDWDSIVGDWIPQRLQDPVQLGVLQQVQKGMLQDLLTQMLQPL